MIKCPDCGSKNTVEILYGMPSYEAFEAEQRGELVLGGCIIDEDNPTRACKECGHQFDETKSNIDTSKKGMIG